MKIKLIIKLFSVVSLVTPSVLVVSCQTQNDDQKAPPIVVKDYFSQIDWNDHSIIDGLKKPNTWANLWADILLLNKLNADDFSQTVIDKNLSLIREAYKINNQDLNHGEFESLSSETIEDKTVLVFEEYFHNYQDEVYTYSHTMTSDTFYTPTFYWTILQDDGLNFWKNLSIQFIDNSFISHPNPISLNFSNSMIATSFDDQQVFSNTSHEIIAAPKTGYSYKTYILVGNTISKGEIKFNLNWNHMKLINLVNNNGDYLRINLGWSLWAIAQRSGNNFFSSDSQDLFSLYNISLDNKTASFSFNIPVESRKNLQIMNTNVIFDNVDLPLLEDGDHTLIHYKLVTHLTWPLEVLPWDEW